MYNFQNGNHAWQTPFVKIVTKIPLYSVHAPEHLLIPLAKLPCSSGQTQCVTTCESNGSCKVKIVNGPPGKLADPENWIYWSICPFSDLQN